MLEIVHAVHARNFTCCNLFEEFHEQTQKIEMNRLPLNAIRTPSSRIPVVVNCSSKTMRDQKHIDNKEKINNQNVSNSIQKHI